MGSGTLEVCRTQTRSRFAELRHARGLPNSDTLKVAFDVEILVFQVSTVVTNSGPLEVHDAKFCEVSFAGWSCFLMVP
jgi:hypothetical protein